MGHDGRVRIALNAEMERGPASAIMLPAPPKSRLLLGLLAALLVNGGLLLFLQRDRPITVTAKQSLIALRIIAPAPVPERPVPQRASVVLREGLIIREPAPLVPVTAPAVAPAISSQVAVPASSAASAPAKAEPLRLALPAGRPASGARADSMLSQMLNDSRANSPKRSVEYVVADAAGTLPVTVTTSTDGTGNTLVRQGSKCTRVVSARISELNPMDKSAQGFAGMSGACTR